VRVRAELIAVEAGEASESSNPDIAGGVLRDVVYGLVGKAVSCVQTPEVEIGEALQIPGREEGTSLREALRCV